jgi:hypothetical protein
MFDRCKAVWAKFTAAFWTGFEQARAESGARAQPAPRASYFDGMTSEEIKTVLEAALRGAHDESVAAERKRIAEVLQAPGAALFPTIAIDLALGTASGAQAAAVLSRAQTDAAKRAGLLKPVPLESAPSAPTVH